MTDDYGRRVQEAAKALVAAVWDERDAEARVEAWQIVQRVIQPATAYDFSVRSAPRAMNAPSGAR